jgi:Rho-binding antiterminator
MKIPEKYIPIDCNYYDRLEAWATEQKICDIIYRSGISEKKVYSKILNLELKAGVEYLRGEKRLMIRLDDLVMVNGIPLGPDHCHLK